VIPALFFATGQVSQAQTEVAFGSEDEIVVTGQYLAFDQLNALRAPTPIIDVPQSLSIMTSEQIEDHAFSDIGDILRYTPGLSVSQGEGHRDAIIIRGQQTTADFFLDGMRDDVQYYRPLYNVEQVEILRGANALLFGRGGTGGIVNRVTKSPNFGESFSGLNASVNTFGAYSFEADTNQPLSETVGFRLNAFVEELNNHRDFYDGTRFGINPTLGVELTPYTRLDLSYEYLNDDRVVDRGVPSQNVEGGPDVPLEGFDETFFGSADENNTQLTANILRARVDHQFSNALRGNISAQYADYDKAYQNLFASEEVTVVDGVLSEVELDGYRDTTERQNLILQGNLVGEFETGSFGHTLIVGAEYAQQDTDNARFDNVFAENGDDQLVIPFFDPLNIPDFGFTSLARNRESEVSVFSAYIQNQIDLSDAFQIVLGARYDSFDINVNDLAANAEFSRKDEEITPRLGAIYKPAENVSFYASYSESFLPRSGDQFLTLDLDTASTRPQFFENKEIGAKWDIIPGLSFTTAIFQLDRESFTSTDPEDVGQLITVDGSRTKGFEAQLTGQVTDAWFISTGYSYLDGEVEDLSFADGAIGSGSLDGNRTRQTPKHMVSVWNRYQLTEQFGLGAGATYQDSFFVREDNSVEVPDFIRFDAAAYYDFSDRLRVQLNVENLFDTNYFPDAHSNDNISTGEPLNARLSLSTRF
jgi:catecholate siderophore receptor